METVEDLVVRAQTGDAAAYDAIVRRFQDAALSYAYSVLGDFELAEDARQEAFIEAYCDLLALRKPAAFPAWFRQILRRNSARIGRGRRILTVPLEEAREARGASEALQAAWPGQSPRQAAEAKETQNRIGRAIRDLPGKSREVTRLYYLEEHSVEEIARLLGVSPATVEGRLHAARAQLQQRVMAMAKSAVWRQHLSGDSRIGRSACAEAVSHLEEQLLKALMRTAGALSEEDQKQAAEILCAKGKMHRFLGQMEEAFASFERGMALPALKGPRLHLARFQAEIGLTRLQTADYRKARKDLAAAKAAVQRAAAARPATAARPASGDDSPLRAPLALPAPPALLGAILNGLGACAWGEGNFAEAQNLYSRAARESRKVGCEEIEAEARHNLALLAWKRGELERALRIFRVCLRRWSTLRDRLSGCMTLMNIGVVEENLGRYRAARRHYQEALAMAEEVGFVQVQAATHSNLGSLALAERNWPEAVERNAEALGLSQSIGDRRSEAI
ncbi:MAG TPA: sigma-70 family RNA polymerase sigma factor, partial [Sumerlaeia bacterium]|nr:sigma-70 family RNA polymerase sigma factor [Sumerlaeia bacterium]